MLDITTKLQNYLIQKLHHRNVVTDIIWMQDWSCPHVATFVRQVPQHHLDVRIISWDIAALSPLRSPDLTPLDFGF